MPDSELYLSGACKPPPVEIEAVEDGRSPSLCSAVSLEEMWNKLFYEAKHRDRSLVTVKKKFTVVSSCVLVSHYDSCQHNL